MSRGDLQEMEQSKTAVNANAKPAEAQGKLSTTTPGQSASYEDLGGPTPENYSPTNDSAKIKEPKIKTVHDVVNKNAKAGDPIDTTKKNTYGEETEEVLEDQEVVAEEQVEEEVVAEYDIEEDVNALLGGEELSEEFREKAKVVFEAALNAKAQEIEEALTLAAEQQLQEEDCFT